MRERICPVHAARYPGYEQGEEEQERVSCVYESFHILLAESDFPRNGGDAEDCRPGVRAGAGGGFDGHAVRVVVLVEVVFANFANGGRGKGGFAGGGGYCYGCGGEDGCERVFVERV